MFQMIQTFVLDRKEDVTQHIRIGSQSVAIFPIIEQGIVRHVFRCRQIVDIIKSISYKTPVIRIVKCPKIYF